MPTMNRELLLKTGLPIAAAVLLMGVSCYYQGMWSERWGEFPELEIYAQQLSQVPLSVGEWEGEEGATSSERVRRISGAAGELNRVYRNASGEEVRVMLMCARYRDIFNHAPDRCYPAAGFEMMGKPQREAFDVGDAEAQFFTTTFRKSDPTGTQEERGYWSWTSDGTWLAPTNERLTYGGERALYKLYVFASAPAASRGRPDSDFRVDFIREFVPALTRALMPGFKKAERARKGELVDMTPAPAAAPAAKPDEPETKKAQPETKKAEPAA